MMNCKKAVFLAIATILISVAAANSKAVSALSSDNAAQGANPATGRAWPEINLNVVVLNKDGAAQPANGSEFRLFEDGTERPFQYFATNESPVSVAFLIDTSGSMYRELKLEVGIVKAIAHALPAGSEIMAIQFADRPKFVLPFTPISDATALSFLDHLENRGSSAMFDAVIAAESYFAANAHNPKRALVLLSDGAGSASGAWKGAAVKSLQWPGAPKLYSVFLLNQDPSFPKNENRKGLETMDTFAKAGGGIASEIAENTDIGAFSARLAEIIRSQMVLTFTAADPVRNGKAHKLELRHSKPSVQILAPPVYYAPGN